MLPRKVTHYLYNKQGKIREKSGYGAANPYIDFAKLVLQIRNNDKNPTYLPQKTAPVFFEFQQLATQFIVPIYQEKAPKYSDEIVLF